ncbi:MAG: ribosome maturation factor RimM [Pseudomonadota bacterium]
MIEDAAPAGAGRVVLGRLGSPFGVKGWIWVHPHTRPPDQLFEYRDWDLEGPTGSGRRSLEAVQAQGKGWIVRLSGIADREAAAALTGAWIGVPRTALPPVDEDEGYYWIDLVGLQVVGIDGFAFGRVDSLMETGANDVLVVKGEEERLIPFIRPDVVRRVDLAAGVVEVDWDPDF